MARVFFYIPWLRQNIRIIMLIFEYKLKRGKCLPSTYLGKSFLGKENSKSKGPEAEYCVCLKNSEVEIERWEGKGGRKISKMLK
jgi:hypothetical protein